LLATEVTENTEKKKSKCKITETALTTDHPTELIYRPQRTRSE
jgi:hypothetical protein